MSNPPFGSYLSVSIERYLDSSRKVFDIFYFSAQTDA